ncbi:MAG TPA: hypothetical protein EYG26_05280, partial [Planctomycetes bacterium]|nr:hypothetical protein [Planctomycetota bacterium]
MVNGLLSRLDRNAVLCATVAVAVLVGSVAYILVPRNTIAEAAASDQPDESQASQSDNLDSEGRLSVLSSPAVAQDQGDRVPTASTAVAIVVDAVGVSIPGVIVSWSPLQPDDTRLSWGPAEIEMLLAATKFATTDSSGRADFTHARPDLNDAQPTVLWATKPGFAPTFVALAPGELPEGQRIEMPAADAATIRVLDHEGAPAKGASVFQFGLQLEDIRGLNGMTAFEPAGQGASLGTREACLSLVRQFEVNDRGTVSVSHGRFPMLLLATREAERSQLSLHSPRRDSVTLHLSPATMSASGRVMVADGAKFGVDARVTWLWAVDGTMKRPGQAVVRESGSWGPATIPWQSSGNLEFRLEGADVYAPIIEREFSGPGGAILVDFEASRGSTQRVRVLDLRGSPIENAKVRLLWSTAEIWNCATAWTDEEGVAEVTGCKLGTVNVEVSAASHRRKGQAGVYVPRPEPIEILLAKSASIRGLVTFEGAPVADFSVFAWDDNSPGNQRVSISSSLDGRFEFLDVPIGEVYVIAASGQHAESQVALVATSDAEPTELSLELMPGVGGSGRVVDGLTGEAVPHALVEVQATFKSGTMGPRKERQPVDATGQFHLGPFGKENAAVLVKATGFLEYTAYGNLNAEGQMDFGVIPLTRAQTLQIVIEGPDSHNESGWWFYGQDGPTVMTFVLIPESGRLEFEDVAPGNYTFNLISPDGSGGSKHRRRLRPGGDWVVRLPFGEGVPLAVHAYMEDGSKLPERANTSVESAGGELRYHHFDSEGNCTVEGIPAESVIVSLVAGQGVVLDAVRVDLKGPGPHAVELVGKEPNLVVRLKGISAADTEEGHVGIMSVGSTDLWHTWAQPDAEGEFRFRRPPVESFALIFYHREYGRQGQIFSTLNEGVQVVELEVGIPGRINIIATDRSGPIVGVSWDVRLAAVAASYHTGLTNSEGSTGELLLGEGTFTLSLSRSGYWHIEHDFEVSPPGGRMEFAIRRLGNLAVAVLDGA